MAEGLDKLQTHVRQKELAAAPKYVVRSAAEIVQMNPEPPVEIWGGITLTNDIFQIIGASGIGKSRILLDIALTQVLADTHNGNPLFADLPVYKGPLKWLLLGTENGLYRYHSDLKKMTAYCTEEQMRVLNERLFMTTLEGDGDSYMATDNEENVAKLRATVAAVQPDVLVFDPWGDICGGSELDDKVIRDTVAVLRTMRLGVKDTMPIIIVNHARMGVAENLKATGMDSGNFGKNSKALYTISRCVWNLFHASIDPSEGKVGLYNAKRSNGRPYDERCIKLDPEQMIYRAVEDYDPKSAKAQQVIAASGPRQNNDDVRGEKFAATLKRGIEAAIKAVAEKPISKTSLEAAIQGAGVPVRNIPIVIEKLVEEKNFDSERATGKKPTILWGTAEQIAEIRRKKDELTKLSESPKEP